MSKYSITVGLNDCSDDNALFMQKLYAIHGQNLQFDENGKMYIAEGKPDPKLIEGQQYLGGVTDINGNMIMTAKEYFEHLQNN